MRGGLRLVVGAALALAGLGALAYQVRPAGWRDGEELARAAIGEDRAMARRAVRELRSRGEAGLDALFAAIGPELPGGERPRAWSEAEWARVRDAFSRVARQRDAQASRLFWHTDLMQAREVAQRLNRPILSLRLLGNLDEELSCANSRFFRAVLYANPEISALLRERFVLHWQSVRPVPKLTVDFGDGRVLRTTITGNSIHYVLAPDGRPLDALAGLYAPRVFREALERAHDLSERYQSASAAERPALLDRYHAEALERLDRELEEGTASLEPPLPDLPVPRLVFGGGSFTSWPEATKNRVEIPVIRALAPGTTGLPSTLDDATWAALAFRLQSSELLDRRSRELLAAKLLGAPRADAAAADLQPLFRALERSIADETMRNEQVYRRALHEWLLGDGGAGGVEALNQRVYRELFLSPSSDPFLGLVPPDALNGLDRGGLETAEPAQERGDV